MQTDNSRAVRLVVSLSLIFTTRRTARELRLTAALAENNSDMNVIEKSVRKILIFLEIKQEEISLKYIFDHIRNLGLAAVVSATGFLISEGEPLLWIPYTQIILGFSLFAVGFFLAVLNLVQGILVIRPTGTVRKILYGMAVFILYTATCKVFTEQLNKFIFS